MFVSAPHQTGFDTRSNDLKLDYSGDLRVGTDLLSIATHSFASRVLMLFSVDETLLPM